MGVLAYAAAFFLCFVLPLVSFLRSRSIFRGGGGNPERFLEEEIQTGGAAGATRARRVARRRLLRDNTIRVLFFLCVAVPPKYLTWRTLSQQETVRHALQNGSSSSGGGGSGSGSGAVVDGRPQETVSRVVDCTVDGVGGPPSDAEVLCMRAAPDGDGKSASTGTGGGQLTGYGSRRSRLLRAWRSLLSWAEASLTPLDTTAMERATAALHWAEWLLLWSPHALHRLLRCADAAVTTALLVVPVLPSAWAFLLCSLALDCVYLRCCYLDRRETNPMVRRHNSSWANRRINGFKFRVLRPVTNLCSLAVKRYFSLELVAAYGPLPLFTFPTETNLRILREAAAGHGIYSNISRGPVVMPLLESSTPLSMVGSKGNAAGGSSFCFSSSSDDDDGDKGWDAEELAQLHLQRSRARQANNNDSSSKGTAAAAAAVTSLDAPHADGGGGQEAAGTPLVRDETVAFISALHTAGGSGTHTYSSPSPSSSGHGDSSFMSTATPSPPKGRSSKEAAAASSSAARLPQPASPPPPPALGCATYFFAAHPHGILPLCAITSLMSNVMGRNRTLFVDNRTFPSPLQQHDDREASGRTELVGNGGPDVNGLLGSFSVVSPAAQHQQQQEQLSPDRKASSFSFTITNTRSMGGPSPMLSPTGAAAALALPESATVPTSREKHSDINTTCRGCGPSTAAGDGRNSPAGANTNSAGPTHHEEAAAEQQQQQQQKEEGQEPAVRYAKARHYVYNRGLGRFVLRSAKDEAVPPPGFPRVTPAALRPPLGTFRARLRTVVATFPFYVPIMREMYLANGLLDASYETCKRVLLYNNYCLRRLVNGIRGQDRERGRCQDGEEDEDQGDNLSNATSGRSDEAKRGSDGYIDDDHDDDSGTVHGRTRTRNTNHLLLFPGGASESLLSSSRGPTRIILRRRQGFLKLALHTQSGLVPVFTFGETDYYDQYVTTASRFAAPFEDDSVYVPSTSTNSNSGGDGGEGLSEHRPYNNRDDNGRSENDPHHHNGNSGHNNRKPWEGSRYYSSAIPSSADDEPPVYSPASSNAALRVGSPTTTTTPTTSCVDNCSNEREEAPRLFPAAADAREHHQRLLCDDVERRRRADRERHPRSKSRGTTTTTTATTTAAGSKRLPRWLQWLQCRFQQTTGIALPAVRNILPKRGVRGVTVVGRPIFFELPPDLRRIYEDPDRYYSKEAERPILAAAQEVYVAELRELFDRYAPIYYRDHTRRRLIIV